MNTGYKEILARLARTFTEKIQTADTVASQKYYQCPPDLSKIRTLTITVGSTVYPVIEEPSQEMWDVLNMTDQESDIPSRFFVREGFGIRGSEFGLYPTPSSADNTVTLRYEASDKDMAIGAYTTGTVTVTNGSVTITGSGTTFTNAMADRYFKSTDTTSDGQWYKIASQTGSLVVLLENVYEGETKAGATYQISEAFALPEEMQILPVYYALWHYYAMKRDEKIRKEYKYLFELGIKQGQALHGSKAKGPILRRSKRSGFTSYPLHFPVDGVSS